MVQLPPQQMAFADETGIGPVSMEWTREIYNGVELSHSMSENDTGLQKTYTVDFDPKTAEVEPVVSYGTYVMGGDIMSDLVADEERGGKKVVFGINGDAYDTTNGVPNGLTIRDGVLISTSKNGNDAVGFKADGTAVFGNPSVSVTADLGNGNQLAIDQVNTERKLDTEGAYLLTEQFDKATESSQAGVEVQLSVTTSGYTGVRIGGSFTATVTAVNQVQANADKNTTAIGKGNIVLAANSASSKYAALSALTPGQTVTVSAQNASSEVDWSEVQQAIGIFHTLVKNSVETSAVNDDDAVHPRTAIGIRADGSLVLFQCDGRQPGFADGMTFAEMTNYLVNEKHCVNVFNLDGGGSSTITATLPGDEDSTVLNRPSDGHERANSNALLFIASAPKQADSQTTKLHVYPNMDEGYGTKVALLENGKMSFSVKGTDDNYYASEVDSSKVSFSAEGGIGEISPDGTLTAASGAHEGSVKATYAGTEATGSIDVKVTDSLTKLVADRSIVSVAPGATTQLSFTGEDNGVPVVLTSDALAFKLSDDSLGTIAADGTFTAADTQGTGTLEVSYKDCTLTMPVEIGKLPVTLNDFEQPLEEVGWTWRYFTPERGGDASMSINHDERFVKSGDGSLRVDYDFATKPLTGTVTCEAGPVGGMELEGQPKAIGCWIYGDGQGAWVRIQLAPAAYAGDTFVDWKGWKYIETPIPSTASFPYNLKWGIRVLSTPTTGAPNKKGTIYVDGLRAVYDYKNDDTAAPEMVPDTDVSPSDGATEVGHQPDISFTVRDPQVEGSAYTGINTDRTKLWINGRVMDNVLQETLSDGSVKVSYIPSALTSLRSGLNKIKYRIEDNAGNKYFKEWSFTVAGYAVNLEETKPAGEKAAAGSTFDYIVNATDYKNFENFDFDLSFNPLYVKLVDASYDNRLNASVNEVDKENGSVKFSLSGMKDLPKDENNPLVKLRFQVTNNSGGQTGIKVNKAVVRQTGEVDGTDLYLEGYDRELAFKYTLSWDGSTAGRGTTFTVTDSDGNPVAGMPINVKQGDNVIDLGAVTDENGQIATDKLTSYPVGTSFTAWVVDDAGALSNEQTVQVYDSLGSLDPEKIAVTTGENPATSVGISWETSLAVPASSLVVSTNADLSDARTVDGESRTITTSESSFSRLYQSWGVKLTDLPSDTTFYYKVGQEGHWSEVKSFTTARGGSDTTIAFYGDIQGSYDRFPETIEALRGFYPDVDMSLIAGDVSDSGQLYSEWSAIDAGFGSYLGSGIWGATIGNHDSYFDAQSFTGLFNGPDNGTYTTPRNYWFESGDMVIYNLDTEATYSYDPGFKSQISHMEEVFSASSKPYKVVLMHRSAYPMNYNEEDVRALASDFDRMGVSLVLSGHDHIYSRTNMTGGERATDGSGVYYVVGGCSSGSKFYDADVNGRPWQDVVYDDNSPVFSVVKTEGGKLTVEAYAMEGGSTRMIDSFTLSKPNEPVVPTYDIIYHLNGGTNVASNPASYEAGSAVKLADPSKEGYVFDGWYADADFTTPVSEISADASGSVELWAKWRKPATFSDVDQSAWYASGVSFMEQKGLMTGYSDTTLFGVGDSLTRAQLAMILWRQAGKPEASSDANETGMPDVEAGQWYTSAANWAVTRGVIKGVELADGTRAFQPDEPATFEQAVVILGNYAAQNDVAAADTAVLSRFVDQAGIASWSAQSMAWAVEKGLITGYEEPDGYYARAGENMPRERGAVLLKRAFELGILK